MRDGWSECSLGDIAEVLDRMRKPISGAEREKRIGGVPYYGATGQAGWIDKPIFDEELVLLGEDAIDFLNPDVHKAYLISGPSWVNNHAHVLRAKREKVLSFFLMEALNAVDYSQFVAFGTRSKLTQGSMMGISVRVPPLVEQKRIVDVVSSVDAYIDALQQQADTARTARNAVLHELLSAGGDDWTETTLGAHIKIVMGQAPPGKDCNKDGIGIPFVKAGEFTDGFPLVREWTTNPLRFSKLGDTLICVVGATCGKLSKGIDCAIGRSVAALQPLETLDGGFLWNFMARKVQEMRDGSRGSAQGVITKDDLADLLLRLPPVEEQKRIVEIVSSMSDVIQLTEQAVTDAKSLRLGLLSDLLSGEHEIPASYDSLLGAA